MHSIKCVFALVLGLGCPAIASAQDAARTALELREQLDALLRSAAEKGFGGALIVTEKGSTIFEGGYGLANREKKIPFTPDTVAQTGSITKTFTAAAVSQLASEGKIDLSAPLGRYLTTAAEPGASLKIRDVLTHSSGLMDACGRDFEPLTKRELLQACLNEPLAHKSGDENYSNMGYSVMAALVEERSGAPWEDYLRQRFWRPLKLRRTGFTFRGVDHSRFAMGYLDGAPDGAFSSKLAKLKGNNWNLRGNGGIQSSPRDMITFFDALVHDHPVLSAGARKLMLEPHAMRDANSGTGFGLFHRYKDGKPYRMSHSGSDGVIYSFAAWYRTPDVLVYYVGNNGERDARDTLSRVLGRIERYLGFIK